LRPWGSGFHLTGWASSPVTVDGGGLGWCAGGRLAPRTITVTTTAEEPRPQAESRPARLREAIIRGETARTRGGGAGGFLRLRRISVRPNTIVLQAGALLLPPGWRQPDQPEGHTCAKPRGRGYGPNALLPPIGGSTTIVHRGQPARPISRSPRRPPVPAVLRSEADPRRRVSTSQLQHARPRQA